MKRFVLLFPLLFVAPFGYFIGSWLDGVCPSLIPFGLMASAASMFLLPWFVAYLIAWKLGSSSLARSILFFSALVFQGYVIFAMVPPAATAEMMGIAHRLKSQFSSSELRYTAQQLIQKQKSGVLLTADGGQFKHFLFSEKSVFVADSEMPAAFKEKFRCIYITTNSTEVRFALNSYEGILCDKRSNVLGFFECSITNGVHAYRYQRM